MVSPLTVVLKPRFPLNFTISRLRGRETEPSLTTRSMYLRRHVESSATCFLLCLLRVMFLATEARYKCWDYRVPRVFKDAFPPVPADPAGSPTFKYTVGGHVVVAFRLQSGWRNSPGNWRSVPPMLSNMLKLTLRFTTESFPRVEPLLSRMQSSHRAWHGRQFRECFLRGLLRRRWHSSLSCAMVTGWSPSPVGGAIARVGCVFSCWGERGASDPRLMSTGKSYTGIRNLRCWGWFVDTDRRLQ